MGKVVLDAETQAKLNGLTKQSEVYDEHGNLLGYIIPAAVGLPAPAPGGWGPFTAEEVDRAFRQTGPGRPLDDILKDAGLQ